jgi:hypothetical protein
MGGRSTSPVYDPANSRPEECLPAVARAFVNGSVNWFFTPASWTLTNSPPHPRGSPLERTGISKFFERQFSVDVVRQFKPALQPDCIVTNLPEVAKQLIVFRNQTQGESAL